MEVVVYTDASHCHWSNVAACGFLVLVSGNPVKHEITLISSVHSSLIAECQAVSLALQYCFLIKDVSKIIVYTEIDAFTFRTQNITKNHRRAMKESNEIIEIIKSYFISIVFRYVKAHSGNHNNNIVDNSVRKALNDYRKQNNIDPFTLQLNIAKAKNAKSWG